MSKGEGKGGIVERLCRVSDSPGIRADELIWLAEKLDLPIPGQLRAQLFNKRFSNIRIGGVQTHQLAGQTAPKTKLLLKLLAKLEEIFATVPSVAAKPNQDMLRLLQSNFRNAGIHQALLL